MLIDQQASLNKPNQLSKFSRHKQASEIDSKINCLHHYNDNLKDNDLLNMTEEIDCRNKSLIEKSSFKTYGQDVKSTREIINNSVDTTPPATTDLKDFDTFPSLKPDHLVSPKTCYKSDSPCYFLSTPPHLSKPNFSHFPNIPDSPKISKETHYSIGKPKLKASFYPGELGNHHFPQQPPIYYYGHRPAPTIQPFHPITNCSMTKNHETETSSNWALNPAAQSQYMCDSLMIPMQFHGMVNPVDQTRFDHIIPRSGEYSRSGAVASAALPRRKNATRETTSALKAWLVDHRKNPYPTKGEKIMLAIITKMTLTQVSTWFANARRRLKKENKFTNASATSNRRDDHSLDDDLDDDVIGADDGSSFEHCSSDGDLSPNITSHSTPVKVATEKTDSIPSSYPLGPTNYAPLLGSEQEHLAFYSPYHVGYGAQPPQNALMFDPVLAAAAAASYYYGSSQPQNLPESYYNRGRMNFTAHDISSANCRVLDSEAKGKGITLALPHLKRSANSDPDILDGSKIKKQKVTSKSPDSKQLSSTNLRLIDSPSSPTMPKSNSSPANSLHSQKSNKEESCHSQYYENTIKTTTPKISLAHTFTPSEKIKPSKIWSMVDIVSSDSKTKLDPLPPSRHNNDEGEKRVAFHIPHAFQPPTPAVTYLNPYHPFFYPGMQNPYDNVAPWNYLMYPSHQHHHPQQVSSRNANIAKISQQQQPMLKTHNNNSSSSSSSNITQVTNGPDGSSP